MSGYLGLILGPMFSGKTSRLIQIYKTHTYIQKKVVVINFSGDTRYSDEVLSTHDGVTIPCIFIDNITKAWTYSDNLYYEMLHNADTILINEGQLFSDLRITVLEMVEREHKEVYVCGLDGDYKRCKFGELLDLIPFCDSIEKLSALCADCRDGTAATFSHRISGEQEQVVIGSVNYKPLCRKCYMNSSNQL